MTDYALVEQRGLICGDGWIYGATLRQIGATPGEEIYVLFKVFQEQKDYLYATVSNSKSVAQGAGQKWLNDHPDFWEGPAGTMLGFNNVLTWFLGKQPIVHNAEQEYIWSKPINNWPSPLQGLEIPNDKPKSLKGSKVLQSKKKQFDDPPEVFIPRTIIPKEQRMTNEPCVCEHHLNAHGQRESGGSWQCFVATCTCRGYRYQCHECAHVSMRSISHGIECRTGALARLQAEPSYPGAVLRDRFSVTLEIEADSEV